MTRRSPDLSDLKARLLAKDAWVGGSHPYIGSEHRGPEAPEPTRSRPVVEAEVVEVTTGPAHLRTAGPTAVAKRSSGPARGLSIAVFVTFVILGAGVWGWGAFATFLFALLSTALISNWARG